MKEFLIEYDRDDIGYDLAFNAHRGTSYVPEKRAKNVLDAYVAEMRDVNDEFSQWLTDENREEMIADLARWNEGHLKRYRELLYSRSGLVSQFITGRGGWTAAMVRGQEKKNRAVDNRLNALIEYDKKVLGRLRGKYDPRLRVNQPIMSDDPDALQQLRDKLEALERTQAHMKMCNKIIRKKGQDRETTARRLRDEAGVIEQVSYTLQDPDFAGRIGYPGYKLANNNANIKRIRARIAELTAALDDAYEEFDYSGGIKLVYDPDIVRVQIYFPDKPDRDTRSLLKKNGFKWAPTHGAWQRNLNGNGKWAARNVLQAIGSTKTGGHE